jgi:NADH-quinone oxidoreductase subunit N
VQFELSYIPRLLPELLLLFLALLVLGSDIFERWAGDEKARSERHRSAGQLAAIGLGLIWAIALVQTGYVFRVSAPADAGLVGRLQGIVYNLQTGGPLDAEGNLYAPILGAFATDHLTMIARLTFIGAAFFVTLLTYDARPLANPGEFYALLLSATLGACLMGAASELITAYLAIELTSIPLYVLAGYARADGRSAEAGMKYFVFGALSSGILLYGMSLAYGFAAANPVSAGVGGSNTQFAQIADAAGAAGGASPLLTLAMVLMVAGMGYKVAAVPFHAWSPDVYQGAPTPVTAFISTASKAAGFVLLLRVLAVAFPGLAGGAALAGALGGWSTLLGLVALLSLLGGNLAALPQTNAKRLLAYSSIAQAGFLLLGIVAWSAQAQGDRDAGVASLLYYVIVYCLANLGAFGALAITGEALGGDELRDLNGLARRNLPLAALLTVCVLSLAGIPPLAGFFAKFYIFMAAWQAGARWLVVAAVITTVVALYYYLRFLRAMFIEAPAAETPVRMPRSMGSAVGLAALLLLALGLFPNAIIQAIGQVQFVAAR